MQEPRELIAKMFEKLSKPLWFTLPAGWRVEPGTEGAVNLLWVLQGRPAGTWNIDVRVWKVALTIAEQVIEGATVNRTATTLSYADFLKFWGKRSIHVSGFGTVNKQALIKGLEVNA